MKKISMKNILSSLLFLLSIASLQAQVNKSDLLRNLEKNNTGNQNNTLTATLKSSSRLFETRDDLTAVIQIIPAGSIVQVLDSDSTYLHVIFEDNEGYIYKRQAVVDKAPVLTEKVNRPENQVREEQPAQQQVSRFSYLESKYGTNAAALLSAGKIWKGMSAEMVRDSWGSPKKINRVINGNLIREEWIYNNSWLFIDNDVLSEWGPVRK
jgi:hypothetical protein